MPMHLRRTKTKVLSVLTLLGFLFSVSPLSLRAADDVDALQLEIQNRKAEIASINKQLDEYKKKIKEYSAKSASLQNDVAMIENDIAMTELDVAATQAEIDAATLELQIINGQVDEANTKLLKQKDMLGDLVFALHKEDQSGGMLQAFLGAKDVDDIFRAVTDLETVNGDLEKALTATELTKNDLQDSLADQANKLADLQVLQTELATQVDALEGRRNAKLVLAQEAADSESGYRVLMSELREEQQSITARINALQNQVEDQLAATGDPNPASITWPVGDHSRITTLFHDPSYPFRHLFEHSGLDIAVPQGTAVEAAAPGVVAWAKTGSQYGNYVMIIHADGLATLYAHLSRIDVQQDEYVERGQVIGLSGGRPGTPGAGLSTGSHLHFEVRLNGIPVDPKKYLP